MTNQELSTVRDALNRVSTCKGKMGWYVYRNLKIVGTALEEYEKLREELVRKYGDEKEGTVTVRQECLADFTAELKPIAEIEQQVELCQIDRETFDKLAESSPELTAQELMILDAILIKKEE